MILNKQCLLIFPWKWDTFTGGFGADLISTDLFTFSSVNKSGHDSFGLKNKQTNKKHSGLNQMYQVGTYKGLVHSKKKILSSVHTWTEKNKHMIQTEKSILKKRWMD